MANAITITRIIFSLLLIPVQPFRLWFVIIYICSGLTDMLDGIVARKTHTESQIGAKLDSIADLVFIGICMFKLIPVLTLFPWEWIWIVMIAMLRIINILCGYLWHRKLILLHTILNKVTGFVLFLLPITMSIWNIKMLVIPACMIASAASIQELYYLRIGKID